MEEETNSEALYRTFHVTVEGRYLSVQPNFFGTRFTKGVVLRLV